MAGTSTSELLGGTTLITGSNEFLAERAIASARKAVCAADADADISELFSAALGTGTFADISSPSLFATLRCVVVRALEELSEPAVDGLLSYVAAPSPDVHLVLHHTGGQKGKALLDRLRRAGVTEVKAQQLKKWELPRWVMSEFGRHRVRVDEPTAGALVDGVGEDMRALAGAVEQLVADAAGAEVTSDLVRRYFGGRAEVKGFAVADAVLAGSPGAALEQLRWAFAARVDPVLITSAVASGLRALARYSSAPRGLREADLAREVDVPTWKLRSLATQSRGWTPRGLAMAIQAAARADAEVKGAAGDRLWACERLVISVDQARRLR
jgi:DNA polymerase III subunit delta